jgi:hypothetical protein
MGVDWDQLGNCCAGVPVGLGKGALARFCFVLRGACARLGVVSGGAFARPRFGWGGAYTRPRVGLDGWMIEGVVVYCCVVVSIGEIQLVRSV